MRPQSLFSLLVAVTVLLLSMVVCMCVSAHETYLGDEDGDAGLCQKDEDCVNDALYCRGVRYVSAIEAQLGRCVPKYTGFCKDNGDCDSSKGEVCISDKVFGSTHGHCLKNPLVERLRKGVHKKVKKHLGKGALPIAVDRLVPIMSQRELEQVLLDMESSDDIENLNTKEHQCGNEQMEDDEVLNGQLYKRMMSKKNKKAHKHHDHHRVKNHVHDKFGIMSDAFTEALSSTVPQCGIGRCDNPLVRDSYTKFEWRTVKLDWLLFDSTVFGRAAALPTSEKHISAVTADLNAAYATMKLKFTSSIKVFKLPDQFIDFVVGTSTEECTAFMQENPGRLCLNYLALVTAARGKDWQHQGAFQVLSVDFANPLLNGFAFFPWSTGVHGLVVMATRQIKAGIATMKHELGHAFGLKHTFHGISEVEQCGKCYESVASDFTGDLCSDTNPEPKNWDCGNPSINAYPDMCMKRTAWIGTPYDNIMTYGLDECRQKFTPQQIRRVRCWMDDFAVKMHE